MNNFKIGDKVKLKEWNNYEIIKSITKSKDKIVINFENGGSYESCKHCEKLRKIEDLTFLSIEQISNINFDKKVFLERKRINENIKKTELILDINDDLYAKLKNSANKENVSVSEYVEEILILIMLEVEELPKGFEKCIDIPYLNVYKKEIMNSGKKYLLIDYTKGTKTEIYERRMEQKQKSVFSKFVFNFLEDLWFDKDIENGVYISKIRVLFDVPNTTKKGEALGIEIRTTLSFFGIQKGREDYVQINWKEYPKDIKK